MSEGFNDRVIDMMIRMFISDMYEHYLNVDNNCCAYCKTLTDEQIADQAARRARLLVQDIRAIGMLP